MLACLYWLVRLDASQIEQRYGSPILLPSRPELLVLLAVGRAASAAPSERHPELDALALHGELKEEFCRAARVWTADRPEPEPPRAIAG